MGEPSVLQGHAARSSDSAKRTGFACLGALVLLGLAACAALPEHGKDDISYAAADYSSTALYRASVATIIPADGRSGFRILPVASYAFETRLALARAAEKTLDVQYYILKQDRTGPESHA